MTKLSIVIPAYNEERTLARCVDRVLAIVDKDLELEVIIVDDASTDGTTRIATRIAEVCPNVRLIRHDRNRGKGAALHTGFRVASGDYVAVQDADLEYDPRDLKRLIQPLVNGEADVVLGSRFLASDRRRVLYFWHSVGNHVLTLASNMLTDLNLTDMETCYKVFRRELLQQIELKEERFGFEPEIVSKVAHLRLRIYEMGISYAGRTYAEGKKIGAKDGFRALYCVLRYNLPHAPLAIQFLFYLVIGGICGVLNVGLFAALARAGISTLIAVPLAFGVAAALNYWLCIVVLFRGRADSGRWSEMGFYALVVAGVGAIDLVSTVTLVRAGLPPIVAKAAASAVALGFNFAGRRFIVFPSNRPGPWAPTDPSLLRTATAVGDQRAPSAVSWGDTPYDASSAPHGQRVHSAADQL